MDELFILSVPYLMVADVNAERIMEENETVKSKTWKISIADAIENTTETTSRLETDA
jgi:hypothetical protein